MYYLLYIHQNMVSNLNIDLGQTSSRLPGSVTEKVNLVSAQIVIALDDYVLPIVYSSEYD
jgi:hypothetical protein